VESELIVAELDVAGDVVGGVLAGGIGGPVDAFDFDGAVSGFSPRIIVTGAGAAQGASYPQGVGDVSEFLGCVLATWVAVKDRHPGGDGDPVGGHL